jgi:hypothetical protein
MKTKYLVLGLVITLVPACSTKKNIIDELTITDLGQFTKFREEQILVTTKDTIQVSSYNPALKKQFYKMGLMFKQPIQKYQFTKDSLLINDPGFQSSLGLKAISDVKFKGVWDYELGFVSEAELNENLGAGSKPVSNIVFGAGLGALLFGVLATVSDSDTKSSFSPKFSSGTKALAGGLLGALVGGIAGAIIGPGSPPSLTEALDNVKIKRQIKSEQ